MFQNIYYVLDYYFLIHSFNINPYLYIIIPSIIFLFFFKNLNIIFTIILFILHIITLSVYMYNINLFLCAFFLFMLYLGGVIIYLLVWCFNLNNFNNFNMYNILNSLDLNNTFNKLKIIYIDYIYIKIMLFYKIFIKWIIYISIYKYFNIDHFSIDQYLCISIENDFNSFIYYIKDNNIALSFNYIFNDKPELLILIGFILALVTINITYVFKVNR